jgi:release factor glutamine methyltransferase
MRTDQCGGCGRGRGCAPGVVGARGRVRAVRPRRLQSAVRAHDPRVNNALPATIGPARAWHAGYDGRLVLDPLCEAVPDLLADRGSLLLVQSEFADPRRTLAALSSAGLDAEIVAWQWIPFGPMLTSRAWWLEETDRLDPGREEEQLVIKADKP